MVWIERYIGGRVFYQNVEVKLYNEGIGKASHGTKEPSTLESTASRPAGG